LLVFIVFRTSPKNEGSSADHKIQYFEEKVLVTIVFNCMDKTNPDIFNCGVNYPFNLWHLTCPAHQKTH